MEEEQHEGNGIWRKASDFKFFKYNNKEELFNEVYLRSRHKHNIREEFNSRIYIDDVWDLYDTIRNSPWFRLLESLVRKAFSHHHCCCNCGKHLGVAGGQLDHIVPKVKHLNGWVDPYNLQLLCSDCNKSKFIEEVDFRTPEEKHKCRIARDVFFHIMGDGTNGLPKITNETLRAAHNLYVQAVDESAF